MAPSVEALQAGPELQAGRSPPSRLGETSQWGVQELMRHKVRRRARAGAVSVESSAFC